MPRILKGSNDGATTISVIGAIMLYRGKSFVHNIVFFDNKQKG
jgi:hypothetical protein